MARPTRMISSATLAALGLTSLTPVQHGAALLAAGTTALWTNPALAQGAIPGVGTVVKKKPGNSPIIVPSDRNGEVRLTGLEPGIYSVKLIGSAQEVPMRVGQDGRLAFAALHDTARPRGSDRIDPRRAPPLLVIRRWVEAIPFDGVAGKLPDNAVVLDARLSSRISPPTPCAPPPAGQPTTCRGASRLYIDVNAASAEEIIGLAPLTSRESAAIIVAERQRGGPFRNVIDFASRTCTAAVIDFEDAALRLGNTVILMKRGGNPKDPGFKCARDTRELELFGKKHNYVGHVTLLR